MDSLTKLAASVDNLEALVASIEPKEGLDPALVEAQANRINQIVTELAAKLNANV